LVVLVALPQLLLLPDSVACASNAAAAVLRLPLCHLRSFTLADA
jgi:hypothetical protein